MGAMGDTRPSEEELNAVNIGGSDSTPGLRMVLLLGEGQQVLSRSRYDGLFDAIFVSNLTASNMTNWLSKSLNRDSEGHPVVVVETAKYALDLSKDQKTEFIRRLYVAGTEAAWQLHEAAPRDGQAEPHLHFVCCGEEGAEEYLAVPELPITMVDPNAPIKPDPPSQAIEGDPSVAPTEDQQPDPTANGTLVTAKSHNANDAVSSVTGVEVMVVQRNPDRVTRRPKELLVKIRLPGLSSAAGVDINIDGAAKTVKVDHMGANLHAEATLAFPVNEEKGSATFDADTSLLILTLPVVATKEDEKDALKHLENEEASENEEAPENCESNEDQNAKEAREFAMLHNQKRQGVALPRRLGQSIMF